MHDKINYTAAPNQWGDIWQRYIEHGLSPGGFGTALLCNDLTAAVRRADPVNIRLIGEHVQWLWDNMIYEAWGTRDKYNEWILSGGANGQKR